MKLLLHHLYPEAAMGLPHCILTHHAVQEVQSRPVTAPQLASCISVHLSLACRPVTLASRLDWLDFITNSAFWKLLVPNSLDLCEHELLFCGENLPGGASVYSEGPVLPHHTLVPSVTEAPAPGWGGEAVGTRDSKRGTWFLIPGFEEMCFFFLIIFLFIYLAGFQEVYLLLNIGL